ncbi:MAG: polymer-forming cytoskeletal protein [Candidatus Omnitrophota bacterium]
MRLKKDRKADGEKILEVDASMQGTLTFRDPVNLRINGSFEGNLTTKGNLMIGENAKVKADIIGESIVIAGTVDGSVIASRELKLISPAVVIGNITTPVLIVEEGSVFEGVCNMHTKNAAVGIVGKAQTMTVDELARYLEVETSTINDWVASGKLPSIKDGGSTRFDRNKVDEWVLSEKIR